jgi:hypothetical protein
VVGADGSPWCVRDRSRGSLDAACSEYEAFADLLDLARERISLVTVAACWSAAMTAAEQCRLLGLPVPDQREAGRLATPDAGAERMRTARGDGVASEALVTSLAERLGCAVLADESGLPGVLLHGMPGAGKTACALELAYTHEHAFDRLVWFKASDKGQDIRAALTDFALTLERDLPEFRMVHVLADKDKLTGFLPMLTEMVELRRVLIVIDNAESLLTETSQWRDNQWGQVAGALTAHAGAGRLVLTSRRAPATGTAGLRVESVDALSADEALLLSRELPHLNTLIRGELPGVDREVSRRLVLGVLTIAQGHPKLLELANGQAADPKRLAELVAAGGQAWLAAGGLPDGFFSTGESGTGRPAAGQSATDQSATGRSAVGQATASAEDYLHVLGAWTRVVCETRPDGERALFWFLCCLEEADRERFVLISSGPACGRGSGCTANRLALMGRWPRSRTGG